METHFKLAVALAAASITVGSQAIAGKPAQASPAELAALQSHRYSVSSDVAFHAALATLQTMGFQDIDADKVSGTISATTDAKAKTIYNFFWGFGKKKWTEKAQLLVEDYGQGSQVRLTLSLKETKARGIFGTSFTDGELVRYAQPYQDFFAALDAEVQRRGGAVNAVAAMTPDPDGSIDLGDGIKLVPAQTASGYCIRAAPGYVGTGAANRPSVTDGRPLCGSRPSPRLRGSA